MKKEKPDKRFYLGVLFGSSSYMWFSPDDIVFMIFGIIGMLITLILTSIILHEELIQKKKGAYVEKEESSKYGWDSKFTKIQFSVLTVLLIFAFIKNIFLKENLAVTLICYVLIFITLAMIIYELFMKHREYKWVKS